MRVEKPRRNILTRILKFFFGGILFLALGLFVVWFILDKPLPDGKEGPKAEELADKMLQAVNASAWDDIHFLKWTFPRGHGCVWDRERNLVQVSWEDYVAVVNPELGTGIVHEKGALLTSENALEHIGNAIHYFWNDSFWLMGFLKIRDPGTSRKYVELEGGLEGLLVTYDQGGTTPGDSYLWMLDAEGLPRAWQMWVDLIPIGGLKFSWELWATLPNGARYAPVHINWLLDIVLENVQAADRLEDLGIEKDIFDKLAAIPTK